MERSLRPADTNGKTSNVIKLFNRWSALALTTFGLPFLAAGALAQMPPRLQNAPPPQLEDTQGTATLYLSAVFSGETKPIGEGLVWRVYADAPDGEDFRIVIKSEDASPSVTLPKGDYRIHAAYGFASATRRVSLTRDTVERLTISAGGLRIRGAIGANPIPPERMTFSVFVPVGNNDEGRLVVEKARSGSVVRLPEGTYHVVSSYGDSNALMRADLKVENGKLTDATLNHRAATVTLKLVRAAGGEAFAGTAFSVLTPGGDVIREEIGAFPSFILAEGEYVVIARHEGQVYTREFTVESGQDRDIEVVAR